MGWSHLLGQDQTVTAFKRAIRDGNLAHAIFLWGSEGVGKSTAASLLAAHWLCLSPTEDGPCGACQSCLLREHGNHPDLITVDLEEGSRNIGIEGIYGAAITPISNDALFQNSDARQIAGRD